MSPFDSKGFNLDDTAYLGGKVPARSYAPFQVLFLLRLSKLLRDRQDWSKRLAPDDWRQKLLNKAIYSTFCDCVEQGVAEDARSLFTRSRHGDRV
jgi:hypothetical protein